MSDSTIDEALSKGVLLEVTQPNIKGLILTTSSWVKINWCLCRESEAEKVKERRGAGMEPCHHIPIGLR
jgi:hypothetical protein